ncbi:hypothetical protein CK503_11125 [Aliifodinibius salipaludis]|uniref:Uncharacterized protein n=1 Tax=Fodinibius salipaludis TaxID=2032627 RepID=A0A2A2GA28_9BACT|nr:hypothetical protein [Aliifodinibius salipaludis]PAU93695.1 hypothetical protein CK503_11125 [Aliifodinibius salipaludis]
MVSVVERFKPQSISVYSDSISTPERPTFTAQEDTIEENTAEEYRTPSATPEDLAPGTVLVKAVVISADLDREANKELTIKSEEILGYASATSPIAVEQELTVSADWF